MLRVLGEFPLSIKIIIVTGAGAAGYLLAALPPWRRAARAALAAWRSWRARVADDRRQLEQLEQLGRACERVTADWIGSRASGGGLFVDAPGSGPPPELTADDIDAALAPNGYWRAHDRARRWSEQ